MARKLGAPIALGVITVLALIFITGGGTDDKDILRQTLHVDAVYYDTGYVEISFIDKSDKTDFVVMEILGMDESFQKTFSGTEFIEIVPFPNPPKHGWPVHPIVLEIEHQEFGHVQIKTEIYPFGEPAPNVIYSQS